MNKCVLFLLVLLCGFQARAQYVGPHVNVIKHRIYGKNAKPVVEKAVPVKQRENHYEYLRNYSGGYHGHDVSILELNGQAFLLNPDQSGNEVKAGAMHPKELRYQLTDGVDTMSVNTFPWNYFLELPFTPGHFNIDSKAGLLFSLKPSGISITNQKLDFFREGADSLPEVKVQQLQHPNYTPDKLFPVQSVNFRIHGLMTPDGKKSVIIQHSYEHIRWPYIYDIAAQTAVLMVKDTSALPVQAKYLRYAWAASDKEFYISFMDQQSDRRMYDMDMKSTVYWSKDGGKTWKLHEQYTELGVLAEYYFNKKGGSYLLCTDPKQQLDIYRKESFGAKPALIADDTHTPLSRFVNQVSQQLNVTQVTENSLALNETWLIKIKDQWWLDKDILSYVQTPDGTSWFTSAEWVMKRPLENTEKEYLLKSNYQKFYACFDASGAAALISDAFLLYSRDKGQNWTFVPFDTPINTWSVCQELRFESKDRIRMVNPGGSYLLTLPLDKLSK